MIYYKQVENKEHMLYAREIAELYGIVTLKENPHTKIVTAALEKVIDNIFYEYEQLYYIGRSIHKVYPKDVYEIAINFLFKESVKINDHYECRINNRNYSYKKIIERNV